MKPVATATSWRTVGVLAAALALGASTGPLVTLSGGIIGQSLAPSPLLATLPVTLLVLGVATNAVPAAMLMARIGRRTGFMIGAGLGAIAALVAAAAINAGSFALFSTATFLLGGAGAFAQQYRFAAAESVDASHAGRAISFVMLGGIAAGVLGPEIGRLGRSLLAAEFSGAFVIAALIQTVVIVLLGAIRPPPATAAVPPPAVPTATSTLLRRPSLALAVIGGAVAYAAMSFLMTATPISMHVIDGHSLDDTARVIQGHVIAMYAPSLVTGFLVDWLGVRRMMIGGAVTLLACTAIAGSSHAVPAYWMGLVLLGVGWNLLFVGATVLLTRSYAPHERFRAQAINDLGVFGTQACASLASGAMLHQIGWRSMNVAAAVIVASTLAVMLAMGTRAFTTPAARVEPTAPPDPI